jgi:protein-disulfide isomerase
MRTRHFWHFILLTTVVFCSALRADSITFSLLPSNGNVSGPAGSLVGWGYSLTNNSTTDWFLTTNLNSDSFSHGTPNLLFDFPELAPSATVTELFNAVNGIGIFELQWDASAPVSFVNSGDFTLSGQWYDGDPFNGGSVIADATDTLLPYSATVTGRVSGVPEPSSLLLLASGIAAMIGWRTMRNHPLSRISMRKGSRVMHCRQIALILTLALLSYSVASAQQGPVPSDDAKDSGITRQQADEILNELKAIRQLLEKQNRPALPRMPEVPQTGRLRLEGGYSLGSNDAPITIVEFTDYQCPFCRRFESTTFAEIRKKYIDTGKVRFVVRDFPLAEMHPDAMLAAGAARCAGDQGQFWPMHDALFSEASKLAKNGLIDSAESLKLDMTAFRSCLESGKHNLEIQNDQQVASSLQINGTPSFLIGTANGEEVSGAIVVGAQPFSVFEAKFMELEAAH